MNIKIRMSPETKPKWPNNAKFAVCLTHDVDRVKKSHQYITHSLKALVGFRFRDLIRQICDFRFYFDDIEKNPYWNFPRIMELERRHGVKSTFFFLNESGKPELLKPKTWKLYRGRYSFNDPNMKRIIKKLDSEGWEVALHGSYRSYNDEELLKKEKRELEDVIGTKVLGIRQHYLNLKIPKTWEFQMNAGFKYDASFGLKYTTGFKKARYHPFYLFNNSFLEIPLAIMDIGLFLMRISEDDVYPQTRKNEDDILKDIEDLMNIAEERNGLLTILWHQRVFNEKEFPGWVKIYEKIIIESKKRNAWITNCRGVLDWMEKIKNERYDSEYVPCLTTKDFEGHKDKKFENLHIVIPLGINYLKPEPGGTEAYVRLLICPMRRCGLKSTLLGIGESGMYFEEDNLRFITIDRGLGTINNFKFVCKLFLNKIRFRLPKSSLIVANREEFCLPFLIPWKKAPMVLTEHGNALPILKKRRGEVFGVLYEFFVERFVVNRVDKIITVNEDTRDYLIRKYPKITNKIEVIPLGVDVTRFRLMDMQEMRRKHGFDPDENIVMYVGRLAEEKGLDLLLNSFKEVERQLKNVKLLLVGDGKVRKDLEELATDLELQNVLFMGTISHDTIPELLNCANLFVLCSSRETGPLVVEEALACGVPVVSTDVGRVREFIQNDTVGKIVARNKEDISRAIIDFLRKENREGIRKECRDSSLKFSFDSTARETIEVYKKVYEDYYTDNHD